MSRARRPFAVRTAVRVLDHLRSQDRRLFAQLGTITTGLLSLDTAFEAVQGAAAHAHPLGAVNAAPPLVALAALLIDASATLHATVQDAGVHAPTSTHVGAVAELQKCGDVLYYTGVGALFSRSPNAPDVLRWKAIYDAVRQALSKCADVADLLTQIGQ